jgi:hypothetical protein
LKLSNVAWKVVSAQFIDDGGCKTFPSLVGSIQPLQERVRKHWNIIATIPQRWHLDVKNLESIQKVVAKLTSRRKRF